MAGWIRTVALAGLTVLLGVSAGCTDSSDPPGAGSASHGSAGPPWYDGVAPATAASKVGADDTPCELPIGFDLPAKWKVSAVDVPKELADLAKSGGATMRCEADADPGGHIGFLRVWTVDKGATVDTRQALDEFLVGQGTVKEDRYRDTRIGPMAAVEAAYQTENALTGDNKPERALSLATSVGPVIVTLSATDTDEFEALFPAYQLVKQTIAPSR